jgi:adenine-specific DNA-methyltransferase
MPKNEPKKVDLKSMDVVEDQKRKLKAVFPNVFNEDRVDFDRLKLTLGEDVDAGQERYGMTWPGKAECMKVIQQPSIGTLKPSKKESVDFDKTENLFIEGDNLEVMKLLQNSYYGKIKMIYIDPPYNTGKEFIYPDKYSESLETYLAYTGQVDDEGKRFSTNTEADGRFHSKWLNMMYPRLYLARNLLRAQCFS